MCSRPGWINRVSERLLITERKRAQLTSTSTRCYRVLATPMTMRRFIIGVACLLGSRHTAAADGEPAWSQLISNLEQPPVEFRLMARTAPSSSTLEALAAAGFGGAEVGINFGAAPAQARQELDDLLATGRRVHIQVDLAPGGGQPYVSPGISEADSMQQLVADAHELESNQPFDGEIKQPNTLAGQPVLVAVTAARIDHRTDMQLVLDPDTAIDLTSKLTTMHTLHWAAHPGQWVIFSFWQRATGQIPGPNPFQSPAEWNAHVPAQGPGRYFTADIFSAAGVSSALGFLSNNILPPDSSGLAGDGLAHDSLEVQAEMFWTHDLPREFYRRRGYSLLPLLPAAVSPRKYSFNPLDPRWGGPLPKAPYDFSGDAGERVRYDFDQTLTDLYIDRYLNAMTQWAHARGMHTRDQVAYNYFSLDMLRSARAVDVPENESLDSGWRLPFDATMPAYGTDRWRHTIDSYRLTGSSKDQAGHHRATLEFGDDFAIYRKQPIDYAQQLNESLAGGITMGLLTAFTSTDLSWPKPRGLAMIGLGDDWSSGWPQWRDWPALAGYFARSTVATEFGEGSVDVAIYHDRGLSTVHDDAPLFASNRLEAAGFTYDFIDPAALVDGAPGAQSLFERMGYRALILDNQATIPVGVAHALLSLARKHIPIVIVGTAPGRSPGWLNHDAHDRDVRATMHTLTSLQAVVSVASRDEVAAALLKRECLPAASFSAEPAVLSVHRRVHGVDVWWLYNPSNAPVSSIGSFQTQGVPYAADLWTGEVMPAASWQRSGQRTQVPISLAPRHSLALLFREQTAMPLHIVSAGNAQLLAARDGVVLFDARASTQRLSLSDGSERSVDVSTLPSAITLSTWRLHVDESSPDGPRIHDLGAQTLQDWRSVAELRDVVGQATYATNFDLPAAWLGAERSAVLSIGEVAGAMRVSINGQLVTQQSVGEGRWVVGPLLKAGSNTIEIRLDTTLTNRMAALRAAGTREYQTGPTSLESAASGVLGPVVLSSAALVRL
jgi:hypothetical protein